MNTASIRERLILWLAQGFGSGRAPVAPGTFGTVVGLAWFALLLWPGNLAFYVGGTLVGILVSVWICGEAEKILGQPDPGSVVLDEIVAIPVAFLGWVLMIQSQTVALPGPAIFFHDHWVITLGLFTAFRVFDIWKPWPVRQSQALPGGWGVTTDDVLAAAYVNAVSVPVLLALG